jgi:hypothetical protein
MKLINGRVTCPHESYFASPTGDFEIHKTWSLWGFKKRIEFDNGLILLIFEKETNLNSHAPPWGVTPRIMKKGW